MTWVLPVTRCVTALLSHYHVLTWTLHWTSLNEHIDGEVCYIAPSMNWLLKLRLRLLELWYLTRVGLLWRSSIIWQESELGLYWALNALSFGSCQNNLTMTCAWPLIDMDPAKITRQGKPFHLGKTLYLTFGIDLVLNCHWYHFFVKCLYRPLGVVRHATCRTTPNNL